MRKMQLRIHTQNPWQPADLAAGAAVWALAGLALWLLDGGLDLANLALLPVLAAAGAALWWPAALSMTACVAAVGAFNWAFVPPRGSFTVDLHQHAWLLLTMLSVSWVVTLLMVRLRRLAASEGQHALRSQQLQQLANVLRDAQNPRTGATALQAALQTVLQQQVPAQEGSGAGNLRQADITPFIEPAVINTTHHAAVTAPPGVALLLLHGALPERDDAAAALMLGTVNADQTAGLWLCLRQQRAMGPGTGWHDEQPAWYLPVRGRGTCWGAALLPLPDPAAGAGASADSRRQYAQALCDQMGLELQRAAALQAAATAREDAQAQRLRNTLLAAIAHDHRTPLASILGAASALHDQADRLQPAQRQRLAARIVDETRQLQRLTDNTLQLARLDAARLTLQMDWESVEEMVGSVLRRLRGRDTHQRVKARLEPGLPLLRCDAVLMVQLLDNLVDNALKHGGNNGPVEVLARRVAVAADGTSGGQLLLAVRDRGPGVAPPWRERVFGAFQRVDPAVGTGHDARAGAVSGHDARAGAGSGHDARPGAGVGLALCRSIARAHGGELTLRARSHGGASFECRLPLAETPPQAPPDITR